MVTTERLLSSRAVQGMFYNALRVDDGIEWINDISNLFNSDQDGEQYAWLGMAPVMREWIGGRQAKGFLENNIEIKNKHFEATIEVLRRDRRRDKSGQLQVRINDLVRRSKTHWASLLSTLILNGTTTTCYDGQYFFDTDHSEGSSGTQSNKINVDISELPVETGGTVTAPSVAEMQHAINLGISQMTTFVDDQGEPMNEDASQFRILSGTGLRNAIAQALQTPAQVAETQTALTAFKQDFKVVPSVNVRLNSWTDKFVIFRTDVAAKALIRQQESEVKFASKAEGSEYEFDNDAHQYGIDAWRNVGYGFWQNACLVTLT